MLLGCKTKGFVTVPTDNQGAVGHRGQDSVLHDFTAGAFCIHFSQVAGRDLDKILIEDSNAAGYDTWLDGLNDDEFFEEAKPETLRTRYQSKKVTR
jgi:hypothetical protein